LLRCRVETTPVPPARALLRLRLAPQTRSVHGQERSSLSRQTAAAAPLHAHCVALLARGFSLEPNGVRAACQPCLCGTAVAADCACVCVCTCCVSLCAHGDDHQWLRATHHRVGPARAAAVFLGRRPVVHERHAPHYPQHMVSERAGERVRIFAMPALPALCRSQFGARRSASPPHIPPPPPTQAWSIQAEHAVGFARTGGLQSVGLCVGDTLQ
jgi:hypothetical protein